MLPHPDIVNRDEDEETYVITGPANLKVRVTKDNWNTLRFNTKTLNPEAILPIILPQACSYYLRPVPIIFVKDGRFRHGKLSTFHHQQNRG